MAERRAWELLHTQPASSSASGEQWRLVALNPGFVLGPPCTSAGTSELVSFAVDCMSGKIPFLPHYHMAMVDLSDVGAAHTLALFNTEVTGRFILAEGGRTRSMLDVVKHLKKERFSAYPLTTRSAPKWVLWLASWISPEKVPYDLVTATLKKPVAVEGEKAVKELGLEYHDHPVPGIWEICFNVWSIWDWCRSEGEGDLKLICLKKL